MSETRYVFDMARLSEELLSPEEYLNLTDEERSDVAKAFPIVKQLGATSLEDDSFVSVLVKWKTPRYKLGL